MGGWTVLNRSIWGGKRRSSGVFEEEKRKGPTVHAKVNLFIF